MVVRFVALLALLLFSSNYCFAQDDASLTPNTDTSVDDLLAEAQSLFLEQHPLDARAKLQQALSAAPNDYRPHFYLGVYYLSEVAHFQLADKYLRNAESLFRKKYGSEEDGTLSSDAWRQNARLIQYLTEVKLNLDQYDQALKYANRFGKTYWDDWYPATSAWILMKLRRVDEAIKMAELGVRRGTDETRTYNILGILYSLKGDRKAGLQAFGKAIQAELTMGTVNQAATPLNNAGEVYRELFQDDLAEASWLRALQLPDGCDHILPSLNLALLYIEELRLFQAERALKDFESCFAQRSMRADTEHRALIALARGRIALLQGDIPKAVNLLEQAAERQQWYGKIGTDEADLRFAAATSLAVAYKAAAAKFRDMPRRTYLTYPLDRVRRSWLSFQAWWQNRKARQVAIKELNNIEDLYIHHTDAMLEYPTLGGIFENVPASEVESRLDKEKSTDTRPPSAAFYKLYELEREVAASPSKQTVLELTNLVKEFRDIDAFARAHTMGLLVRAMKAQDGIIFRLSATEKEKLVRLQEELFELLPSHIRTLDLTLPVSISTSNNNMANSEMAEDLKDELLRVRFEQTDLNPRYDILIDVSETEKDADVKLTLIDKRQGKVIVEERKKMARHLSEEFSLLNEFIDKVFGYRTDRPAVPVPKLDIFN